MRMQRWGLVVSAMALAAAIPLWAAAPAEKPAAATAVKKRAASAIFADLQSTQNQITQIAAPDPSLYASPDFRKGDGQKILPLLKKMTGLFDEVEHADIDEGIIDQARQARYMVMAYSVALGDKESETRFREGMQKKDSTDAVVQKAWLSIGEWFVSSSDAAVQEKILDDMSTLAKDHPGNEEIVKVLTVMSQVGAASPELSRKINKTVRFDLNPAMASMDEEIKKQQEMLGKPFAFSGRTSTDGSFDLSSYRGKVVMIDFWATWCGPCVFGLPEVKNVYSEFHDKGLEIVGISCDANDQVLNNFIKENDMPWVQMHEATHEGNDTWHPLAKQFHVSGIPTMFLIDRKGILRFVDARADMAKKVQDLLNEPAPAPKKSE